MDMETAGRLAALRRERGLSQEALAEQLGVSRQAVSKWERAESSPDTDNLVALARLYGISLDALLLQGAVQDAAPSGPAPEAASAAEDTDAAILAAGRAWDAAEAACKQQRRAVWERRREKLLWLLDLVLMFALPLVCNLLGWWAIYAVLVTVVYLVTGFLLDNWHPGWILYLSIPICYVAVPGI